VPDSPRIPAKNW